MFQQNIFQGPGTGTFTTHTFEILFMLFVAFLFGLWLGWTLWSRYRRMVEQLTLDNQSLTATATALRGETDSLKAKLAEADTERSQQASEIQTLTWENESYRNRITVLESENNKLQDRNRQLETELGMAQPSDMEGGIPLEVTHPLPKDAHEELPDLEDTVATAVDEAFDAANLDMPELEDAIADAVTTAIAEKAVETKAEEPAQEETDAAATTTPPATDTVTPKIEQAEEPAVVAAVNKGPHDDLKIIEGIGPKIEELLFKSGINTYGQLAATSVQQIKDILDRAGTRFAMHDPGTWPAQSLLAANGEWDNLKAYQDFLNAGKRPDK